MVSLTVHNRELPELITQLPHDLIYDTGGDDSQLACMLQFIDNNDSIKLHVPHSKMKRYLVVLCNTVVGPPGIL